VLLLGDLETTVKDGNPFLLLNKGMGAKVWLTVCADMRPAEDKMAKGETLLSMIGIPVSSRDLTRSSADQHFHLVCVGGGLLHVTGRHSTACSV